VGKLMFVSVRVDNSEPVSFCIDSGAPHTVIDPRLARRLGLKSHAQSTMTGTGSGAVPMTILESVRLSTGDVAIDVAAPYAIDLRDVPIPATTLGLLGYDAFGQYVVRFDPIAHTITFSDAKRFSYTGTGTKLPLIVEDGRMYVEVGLDVNPSLHVVHRLRVDLGSEDSVNDEIVAQATETRRTTLGNGLGSNFEGVSGVFDAVHLGPYVFHHVWGPGAPLPIIGMEIFRRFVTTFDATHRVLYLEPTGALDEPVPDPGGG
jgi:hypothetical protein